MQQHAKSQSVDAQIKEALKSFTQLRLVLLFGSVASGNATAESDLDIAVSANCPLSAEERISLINALANVSGRPVDLIDLRVAGEPLMGQILRHGRRILGSDTIYAELVSRHLIDQADFMPYRTRLLAERRMAWIGK